MLKIARGWRRRLMWTFVLCMTALIHAEDLEWLYNVEFQVTGQSEQERLEALQEGLEIVLIRVTGLRELPKLDLIDAAFNDLNAYQMQFRYEQVETPDNLEIGTRLTVNYDENAVHALIRDAELPVWSAQRPHVLFLISIVDGERRIVLNETEINEVQRVIRKAASRRGVAFSQPLMDFTDRKELREGSIAFGFLRSVESLRHRARADLVAVARIDPSVFQQHRVWLALHDATGRRVQVFDEGDLLQTAEEVVHRTADYLAQRYAVTGGETTALQLVVTGISDVMEYKGVLDYLEKWEFIDRVLLSSVEHDRIEFELRTSSTWEQFAIHLNEDGVLTPSPSASPSYEQIPEYVWQYSP
ncbi:MAG: DUF2066 domain-containing protein [Pseudomonadales bacterium]|nr:DUF2066 domain-containing protein [Pseudomonadales bacterium]